MADGPLRGMASGLRRMTGDSGGTGDAERAHLEFALRLHRRLAGDPAATSCISPYSVAAALGLLAAGAAGGTRAELVALLADGAGLDAHTALLRDSAELDPATGDNEAPRLSTSAGLWAAENLPVLPEFRETITALPGGFVDTADFVHDPEGVRQTVNRYVAEQTHGLIEDLLPPGMPPPATVALLVTALYLRVSWLNRFHEHLTEDRDFHAPSGTRAVPTMTQTEKQGYAHTDGWQVVGLGAAGGVQATLLLPDDDLATAESTLDGERLAGLLAAQRGTRLALYLPKFALRLDASLTDALPALGAGTMFTDDAEFPGISSLPLEVSEVLHSAVLRLDEAGVEGAAATAVMMRLTSAMPAAADPVEVRVDRPFLVLLRHVRTGAVYFLGRVTEP